jgi:hypothetical protein
LLENLLAHENVFKCTLSGLPCKRKSARRKRAFRAIPGMAGDGNDRSQERSGQE